MQNLHLNRSHIPGTSQCRANKQFAKKYIHIQQLAEMLVNMRGLGGFFVCIMINDTAARLR